jgi:hypothetical protein
MRPWVVADSGNMRNRSILFVLCACLFFAGRADAQFGVSDPAPGEDYTVELGLMFWQPTPTLLIQTGALTRITGGEVDFVQEFGIENKRFSEFRIVARPGRKHKIRFSRVAVRYDEEATLRRTVTFGGRTFNIGAPATADLKWDMYRLGYEWDFVARDRGFVGVIAELKHNKVSADLAAAGFGSEFYEATAPVPAVGVIGRGYPHPALSVTAEFTGFKLPGTSEEFEAKLFDFDIYGTVSIGRHVGIQGGYRSVVAEYLVDDDAGDLKLKGLYFGGLVRF